MNKNKSRCSISLHGKIVTTEKIHIAIKALYIVEILSEYYINEKFCIADNVPT